MKKAFTLIELIIVVLIIAILAMLAIPQYIKAVERSKGGEARFHLRQIAGALGQYRAYYNHYIDIATNGECGPKLEEFMEINLTGDKDWNYTVDAIGTAGAEDQFDANATRVAGPYTGKQITVDENTTWAGDWPLK